MSSSSPLTRAALALALAAALAGCEDRKRDIPVPKLTLSTARADIDKGKELFATKGCGACHKLGGGRLVGPDLKGITARRDQEWIAKMLLRPEVMIRQDEAAKKLFDEYLVPMPNQHVDPERELPFLLAYLKSEEG